MSPNHLPPGCHPYDYGGYYTQQCMPHDHSTPAIPLSLTAYVFPDGSIPITGSDKYMYSLVYNSSTCTEAVNGTVTQLNVCTRDLSYFYGNYERTTAAYDRHANSTIYYVTQGYSDSQCTNLWTYGYYCQYKTLYGSHNSSVLSNCTSGTRSVVITDVNLHKVLPGLYQTNYASSDCSGDFYSIAYTPVNYCVNATQHSITTCKAGEPSYMTSVYSENTCTSQLFSRSYTTPLDTCIPLVDADGNTVNTYTTSFSCSYPVSRTKVPTPAPSLTHRSNNKTHHKQLRHASGKGHTAVRTREMVREKVNIELNVDTRVSGMIKLESVANG